MPGGTLRKEMASFITLFHWTSPDEEQFFLSKNHFVMRMYQNITITMQGYLSLRLKALKGGQVKEMFIFDLDDKSIMSYEKIMTIRATSFVVGACIFYIHVICY